MFCDSDHTLPPHGPPVWDKYDRKHEALARLFAGPLERYPASRVQAVSCGKASGST